MVYIVRDHDEEKFKLRNNLLRNIEKTINNKYGESTVTLTIKEQYRNMKEKIEPCMHLIENAKKAIKSVGLEPIVDAIRGGTDGSQLTYMGLPCPNIFAGEENMHGRYEYTVLESMYKAVDVMIKMAELNAERAKQWNKFK